MRCVTCGVELIAGKKFCHECGTAAGARCDACGATLAAEYHFCPDCGAPIGGDLAAGAPARRRPDAAGARPTAQCRRGTARRRRIDATRRRAQAGHGAVLRPGRLGHDRRAARPRGVPRPDRGLHRHRLPRDLPPRRRGERTGGRRAHGPLRRAGCARGLAGTRCPCRARHPRRARPARCPAARKAWPVAPGADRDQHRSGRGRFGRQ